ncbi:MAG TPA: ATP synthase F1 subunit gamma [bacterium]|nr:ATP synthase F1 subunit gamma [bacterium]HOC24972.1 ATP synthase F1 subunit gamma [bacterium]HOY43132.1 ATP synthase F1 subunit gamma [bacterium]HPG82655.1 ATP synthase F1 subunit gamma [bacterium]HPM58579.1 ATP synthase F1 subunit gamma [bacterium]
MATLRTIKRRIASVRSTQQITKAMKMVAAAKLRKAQNQLLSTRPYAHELEEVLGHIAGRMKRDQHPLLEARRIKRICYVVISADRGLCGSFNANISRRALQEVAANKELQPAVVTIGSKGYDYLRRREVPILSNQVDVFNTLDFAQAQRIADLLAGWYTAKKFDQIMVIYNEFKNAVSQKIVVEQLLPIVPLMPEASKFPVGYIFEPNPERILQEICPLNLHVQLWRILLESSASEHGARMTAMGTASDNAADMIKELVLYYNKARQAAITKELTEIIGGAEALKG